MSLASSALKIKIKMWIKEIVKWQKDKIVHFGFTSY